MRDKDERNRAVAAGATALVLSAGGVFGAYQAGVWKALAGEFQPGLVVGASIGSINGWLIASGCDPEELISLWLSAGELLPVGRKVPHRWHHGILDGTDLESRLTELCSRYQPRIPFAAVTTGIRGLRPRMFVGSEVSVPHLLASCAVPLAFNLQKIGGRWQADGGLLGALPVWAASQLGARRFVAVQVMPPAPRLIRSAVDRVRTARMRGCAVNGELDMITIEPREPLGGYLDLLKYRPERVREWIQRGEQDTAAIKHSILKCFERK